MSISPSDTISTPKPITPDQRLTAAEFFEKGELRWLAILAIVLVAIGIILAIILPVWILPTYVWNSSSSSSSNSTSSTSSTSSSSSSSSSSSTSSSSSSTSSSSSSSNPPPPITGNFSAMFLTSNLNNSGTSDLVSVSYTQNTSTKATTITIDSFSILSKIGTNGVIGFFTAPNTIPTFLLPNTLVVTSSNFNINDIGSTLQYSIDSFGSIRCQFTSPSQFFTEDIVFFFPSISISYTAVSVVPTITFVAFQPSMTGTMLSGSLTGKFFYAQNSSSNRVGLYGQTLAFSTNSAFSNGINSTTGIPALQRPSTDQLFNYQTSFGAVKGFQTATLGTVIVASGTGNIRLAIKTGSGNFLPNNTNSGFCQFFPYGTSDMTWIP